MVLSSVNSEPSQSGEWSENLDVKRANAVNELANVCNEYGAISVDSDGNPKDFTCSNSYYDKAESCWKNISEDDSVESDKCVGDIVQQIRMLKANKEKAFMKKQIISGQKVDIKTFKVSQQESKFLVIKEIIDQKKKSIEDNVEIKDNNEELNEISFEKIKVKLPGSHK